MSSIVELYIEPTEKSWEVDEISLTQETPIRYTYSVQIKHKDFGITRTAMEGEFLKLTAEGQSTLKKIQHLFNHPKRNYSLDYFNSMTL